MKALNLIEQGGGFSDDSSLNSTLEVRFYSLSSMTIVRLLYWL